MRKNFPVVTAVFLALAFLVASAPAQETAAKPAARNVVLIGWDGAQRGHLREMIGRGEVPNLLALSKEGALVDVDVITGATDTKAGWTQILTGYAPAKTGVYSNGKYQPIPVGYTLFERVEQFFGPGNVETVAIIGKKGHVDADAPRRVPYEQWTKREARQAKVDTAKPGLGNLQGGRIVEENGQKFVETPGKPYYNTRSHMDKFVNGLVENDKVGEMALRELERCKGKRFFFFIHFAEPDHSGHKSGENSQEYTDAIESDDAWTGRIIAKLKEAGVYDRTLVYVVVDHGFNEGATGHSYAPYVFLATNDKQVTRNGAREDIAPTVLKHLGVDISKVEPAFDGIPMDQPAPERKAPERKAPAVKPAAPKKKDVGGAMNRFELKQGDALLRSEAPRIAGRSLAVTASLKTHGSDGVIVAQGGATSGYALYLKEGCLEFAVRHRGTLTTVRSPAKVPEGPVEVVARLTGDGALILEIGGKKAAAGKCPGPVPTMPANGLEVGSDAGGLVGDYGRQNTFQGEIDKVTIELGDGQ